MNSVNLIGRLIAPLAVKYVGPTNRPVTEGTIAVDDPYLRDGDKRRSYFFGFIIWGNKAETAAQHMVKGQRIGLTGRLIQDEHTPKGADKPVKKTRISVETFDFLDKPGSRQEAEPDHQPDEDREPF